MFADANTHLAWMRRFALQQATAIFPIGGAITVDVTVVDGLMSGVSTQLKGETLQIGNGTGCDVQLFDDGVAESHATVKLHSSVFGLLADVAAHEAVTVGEEALPAGTSCGLVRLPVTISIGSATLRFSAPQRTLPRWMRPQVIAVALLVPLLALAILLLVNQLVRAAQIETVGAIMQNQPEPVVPIRADGVALVTQQLETGGLAETVKISVGEGGSLLASGRVPSGLWPNWQGFLVWYDGQNGLPLLINSVEKAARLVELRPIWSVQLHDPKTVFFATGQPAQIGDVIEEGWTVTEIDAEGLTLERDHETTRIRF